MNKVELMYYQKELADIKTYCTNNGLTVKYRDQVFYLYNHKIYNQNMEIIIDYAENGFLDLFEFYEYFEAVDDK